MDNYKLLLIAISITTNLLIVEVSAKNETYYGCNSGYHFEAKQKAARCIKKQRQSYKAPLACNLGSRANISFRLKVDQRGNTDLCVPQKSTSFRNESKQSPNKPGLGKSSSRIKSKPQVAFIPKCSAGYKLEIRKGKDACTKGNAEDIKPPSKKVAR